MTNSKTIKGSRYLWHHNTADHSLILNLAASCNLSIPASTVLASRGLTTTEAIRSFICPTTSVSDPKLLKDAERAIQRIQLAIAKKEKILIFGDYDVDGMTATAIAIQALAPLGAIINFALPHRVRDGYGISSSIVKKAANANFSLIITVDNGITAFEAAKTAKKLNVDLIITDHHEPRSKLPDAYAVIDPKQPSCPFPNKELCGAGVIFKLMSLLYSKLNLKLPPKIPELLTLGTIADVVPLINENRILVRQGLIDINAAMSPQLAHLAQNSSLKKQLSSQDIGYTIAPQLNALGRLDDPRDGVHFLLTNDPQRISTIATRLKEINEKRKAIEQELFAAVTAKIERQTIDLTSEHIIIDTSHEWPIGVIGLVAGRLANRYGRPVILLHLTKSGIAKGSCRSIPEINIFDALSHNHDILTSFGGHSCAAGIAIQESKIPELKTRLNQYIANKIPIDQLKPKLIIDATLELPDVNHKLARDLDLLEPFGNANPAPVFLIPNASLIRPPQLLKDKHTKCTIFSQGTIKPVIFFNRPDIHKTLAQDPEQPISIAAQITRNEWNNNTSIELIGIDQSKTIE